MPEVDIELYSGTHACADIDKAILDVAELYSDVWNVTKQTITYAHGDLQWTNGYVKGDGTIATHDYYRTSEYLEVEAGDTITYNGLRSPSSSYAIIALYDGNKSYNHNASPRGDGTSSQSGTFTIPAGISFVRLVTYESSSWTFVSATVPTVIRKFCTDDNTADIATINAEQDVQDARLDALEADRPMYEYHITSFDSFNITTGGTIHKDTGEDLANANMLRSGYISTDGMVEISASITGVVYGSLGLSCVIACYDANKNYIAASSLIVTGENGTWQTATGTITITSSIKFIRISRSAIEGYNKNDTIDITLERSFSADYDVTKQEVKNIEEEIDSVWKGKKWYAFGTSLTDDQYHDPNDDPTGKYPQLLNQYMKANLVNCGRGGGSITSYNGLILQKIEDTDFSDADLVTLEGFPNDYAMPIGELLDTTDDTLAGAIYTAVTLIYQKAPHATVVLITASQGQMNGQSGYPIDFSDGKQLKFNEMTVRMAHYLGCHVIDAGSKAQINNFHPEYLVDQIHHSWAGGQQYADTIWEELKNIHPNTTNPYFEEEPEE